MRGFARGASLLLIAGAAAGCSSGVSRFTGDDFVTNSIGSQNQRQVIQQPGPVESYAAAPSSGGVTRGSLPPVGGPVASAPVAAAPVAQDRPVQVASAGAGINPMSREVERVAEAPRRAAVPIPQAQPTNTLTPPARSNAVASKGGVYTVESGDTMIGVARKHGLTVAELKSANGLTADTLRSGQKLTVPATGAKPVAAPAVVAKVEKPVAPEVKSAAPVQTAKAVEAAKPKAEPVAYTPPKTRAVEAIANDDSVAPNSTGIGKMRWPAKGRVLSGFGNGAGKARDGIDIAVPEGTSVKAAENGVVIYAGDGLKDFGNTVLVRHDNGLVTVYGHNGAINVKRGQTVKRGEQLATSGMSGATETPKLHFEVRKDSSPVDPSTFLE